MSTLCRTHCFASSLNLLTLLQVRNGSGSWLNRAVPRYINPARLKLSLLLTGKIVEVVLWGSEIPSWGFLTTHFLEIDEGFLFTIILCICTSVWNAISWLMESSFVCNKRSLVGKSRGRPVCNLRTLFCKTWSLLQSALEKLEYRRDVSSLFCTPNTFP